ncbi:acetyltransferase [Bacillus sp. J14TS2]|uniref:GNAT family N-acetyltransferase n=1 Tax=Bacillus sp. J14TS2 TaxID=2807188 RepID=UPI001B20A75D|nr:GNAT family N-acetyltransferase [Bacillus sp. J14TS2]GIN74693.1 acetyltransferase [Bacillus sp. J14TS2]
MIELTENEFDMVLDLLQQPKNIHNVFVYSVIEHKQQGKIFVNNKISPSAGLVMNEGGCYYVFGDVSDNVFNDSLIEYLSDPSNHVNFFDMYLSSNEWLEFLKRSLEGNVVQLKRTHYVLEEINKMVQDVETPDGFKNKPINGELFNKYKAQIDSSYSYLWGSSDKYLKNAFGFCLLKNDEFVSVCNTFYIGGKFIAPDIITLNEYRGRGLATIVCSYFIKRSKELGLTPYWDCDAGNEASNRLAQKLGFRKVGDVPILWWHENKKVIEKYLKKFNYVT